MRIGNKSSKEDWKAIPLGDERYFQLATGGTPSTEKKEYWENGTIPWLSSGEVHKKVIRDADGYITEKGFQRSNARFYPAHSILIALAGQGKTRGTAAITEIETTSNQSIAAVIPNKDLVDPYFAYYYLDSLYEDLRSASAGAGRAGLSLSILAEVPIQLPKKHVQERIVAVLASIDRTIEQTKALIAKQRRVKAGLIQNLLTKGIDKQGNVRSEKTHEFKDSSLGRIPREWDVVHLGDVKQVITSGSRGWAQYYANEGALFLRISNLTREHINLRFDDLIRVNLPKNNEGTRTALQEGDILISITADLGIIGVVPPDFQEAYINQHIALVRLDESAINTRWVAYFLTGWAGQRQFQELNESGAKAGLNLPTVASLKVAKPRCSEEQCFIARVIDQSTSDIEVLKQQLAKYKRVKAGLMQDLLTGIVSVNDLPLRQLRSGVEAEDSNSGFTNGVKNATNGSNT